MSSGAITGASNNNYANVIGTGPTKVEKQMAEKVGKAAQEIGHKIVDSAKELVKSPEGKAIVGGLAITPFVPVVGPIIALGGISAAAFKKAFQGTKQVEQKATEKNSVKELGKKAGEAAAAGAIIGGAVVAAGTGIGLAAAAAGTGIGLAAAAAGGAALVAANKGSIKKAAQKASEVGAKVSDKASDSMKNAAGKVKDGAKNVDVKKTLEIVGDAALVQGGIVLSTVAPMVGIPLAAMGAAELVKDIKKK